MVGLLRPQPNAGAIVQPQAATLCLPLRYLQPLPSPDPSNALLIHQSSRLPQQGGDPAISVAPILARQRDDVSSQRRFVIRRHRRLALRRTVLSKNPAGEALGDAKRADYALYAVPAAGGAQKFPEAASFRTSFSSVRSDTARRSRVFSVSSSFRRFT